MHRSEARKQRQIKWTMGDRVFVMELYDCVALGSENADKSFALIG